MRSFELFRDEMDLALTRVRKKRAVYSKKPLMKMGSLHAEQKMQGNAMVGECKWRRLHRRRFCFAGEERHRRRGQFRLDLAKAKGEGEA